MTLTAADLPHDLMARAREVCCCTRSPCPPDWDDRAPIEGGEHE